MSHRFTRPDHTASSGIVSYETQGTARTVSFVQPDGSRRFLSYANLLAGEMTAEGVLILTFTTQIVTLKGNNLSPLMEMFASQTIRSLTAEDGRYTALDPQSAPLVTEILIKDA